MQVVSDDDVEQIVRSKSAIARRFDMIAGYKEFLLAVRSGEDASFGIVGAVSEKLQSQKWVGGAAFSQVNLDRVWLPFLILAALHPDVSCKATDNPFLRHAFAFLFSFACKHRRV